VAGFWRSAAFGVLLFLVLLAFLATGPAEAAALRLLVAGAAVGAAGAGAVLLRGRRWFARLARSRVLTWARHGRRIPGDNGPGGLPG
jgi:hypothetical protein